MVAPKKDVALFLAKSHSEVEPGIRAVYRIEGPSENTEREPIKLLEVNENTIERGIEPISFGPHPASGVHFASIVIDITPREFRLLEQGKLVLPHGWHLGQKLLG